MSATPPCPLAAVLHDGHDIAEPILHAFVERLRGRGVRVYGLLQNSAGSCEQLRASQRKRELVDIHSGDRYSISQELGALSQACCIDSAGVVAASVVLRRALEQDAQQAPELIVTNRFGKIEAEGSGLRREMADIAAAGIPLLTAVDVSVLPAWQEFCGGQSVQLPPDVDALERWWQGLSVEA